MVALLGICNQGGQLQTCDSFLPRSTIAASLGDGLLEQPSSSSGATIQSQVYAPPEQVGGSCDGEETTSTLQSLTDIAQAKLEDGGLSLRALVEFPQLCEDGSSCGKCSYDGNNGGQASLHDTDSLGCFQGLSPCPLLNSDHCESPIEENALNTVSRRKQLGIHLICCCGGFLEPTHSNQRMDPA